MKALAFPILLLAETARAAVLAVATQGSVSVSITDEVGPCMGPARLAIYSDGKQRVPGCWVTGDGMVIISWLDGDQGRIPQQAFQKPANT